MGDCNIRVICRFRPINAKEKEEWAGRESQQIIKFGGRETVEVALPGQSTQSYTFDFVFPPDATQEDVYNTAAKLAVQDVLDGFNGTIFAYGQTGSGKSHSMMGPEGSLMDNPEQRGIIPRACVHIFDHIKNSPDSDTEYAIKCSYLEIYNETIQDLFNPNKQSLKIHESPNKGVWIGDLTEEFVTCEQDVIDLLAFGGSNRAISSTSMNKVSSRSHSCFILAVEQKTKDGSTKTGRLNLVDLAGSEKVGKTGATGQTLEEAKKINQSLSALGNCIHSLTDSKKNKHVPYRDSKLTHILKESLGGNTKTCMLIACSPHEYNIEETISTLKFGQRAKTIKNSVKVNRQLSAAELQARIDALTNQLTSLQKYVAGLEKTVAFMKSPEYVPGKPLPDNLAAPVTPDTSVDGASVPNAAASDSFNAMALTEAQVELQKLKESTAIKIEDLTQELQFLKEQADISQREIDTKQEELSQLKLQLQSGKMELETERTQRELEKKRYAFQETEQGFAREQQQASINELTAAKEELESNLATMESERRQLTQTIDQLERKVRSLGNGGSSTEIDQYIEKLEEELNKLKQEKTQIEALGSNNQKLEELEAKLREATAKATLLQGQLDEAEARATADQETILDELNIAAEKEAELSGKSKQLEEDVRKEKGLVLELQGKAVLAQKQIALLEETIKALKTGGNLLPEQLEDAIDHVEELLLEMSNEYNAHVKGLESAHYASIQALNQQVATLTTEKQLAERKVKEHEAQTNLNQTKTLSENKAMKQQLESTQEENKRLRQKILFLSSQTAAGRPASLVNLGQEAGDQVRNLEAEMQKNQSRLDAATRQLAAEVSKNNISTKRIEQQSERLQELEAHVSRLVAEQARLVQEAENGKKVVAELEELKKLYEQARLEMEQLKALPRAKIFRPLKSGSMLSAYRDKIDFTTIALKSTGSKFLEDARAEAERAEIRSKELR
eukprot:Phypoly_transcript_01893.p1 GENE.Phypoly_transcript_01893~~Phypoly_transcript_01893.p1  ORF type:complete len:964 (+),score=247.70 Phypoly_transcript_01893:126-3017(+)